MSKKFLCIAIFSIVISFSFVVNTSALATADLQDVEKNIIDVSPNPNIYSILNITGDLPDYDRDEYEIFTTDNYPVDEAYLYQEDFKMGEASRARYNFLSVYGDYFTEAGDDSSWPTNKYNCHGYAWYNASEDNPCWIDDPSDFFEDPHCNRIYDSDELMEGDIIVFILNGVIKHSAVINDIDYNGNIECISKCGYNGLYKHNLEDTSRIYFYNDDETRYYRYKQGEHQNTHTTLSSIQHHIDCEVDGCSYNEYHDTIITSVNSNRHRLSCAECDYSVYEDHDLYLHTAEPGDYVVKCRDCSYTIECSEDPEFIDGDETGHWVDCTCGCYSFFEEHSYNYLALPPSNSNRLFYHRAVCSVCTGTHYLPHNWVAAELGGGVVCSDCGLESEFGRVENIMNLSDEELSLLLSSMSEEEIEQFIALLPEDALARVTAILPPMNDDEHLTE